MPEHNWGIHQEKLAQWEASTLPQEENTPRKKFDRGMEEVTELDDAIDKDDREQIGKEAVDVIIRMIGIATIVGANVDELLGSKIKQITEQKYPASIVRANMDMGDSWPQAMNRQKIV